MSYFEEKESKIKYEYQIEPTESFVVIHNCAGCGGKERFINTKRFRVNANGNRLDVWLIYQCQKCKHTLNLSIYERVDRKKIATDEYMRFLKNDEVLAEQYGTDNTFFIRNRAEVEWENVSYAIDVTGDCEGKTFDMEKTDSAEAEKWHAGDIIVIHNPYGIRIRPERLAGMILKLSRSAVKKMIDQKQLILYHKGSDIEIVIC